MTTTSEFYKQLEEAVTKLFVDRFVLCNILNARPEMKTTQEILSDILTIFSISNSVLENFDNENTRVEDRLKEMVEDYYAQLNQGSSNYVGRTPAQLLKEEFDDLAHTFTPWFSKEELVRYYTDLALDEFTKEDMKTTGHLDMVKVIIATVIKSSCLLVKVTLLMKSAPKVKSHEPPVN